MSQISAAEIFNGLASQACFMGLRDSLNSAIAAICLDLKDDQERRVIIVGLFRDVLAHGRRHVRQRLEAGEKGIASARMLAQLQDELIGAIHDYVITFVHVADNPTFAERLALVAVGG